MTPFQLLRKQVKQAWKLEQFLLPSERKVYAWQFSVNLNEIVYLVGKMDANTFYYSINESDPITCMPDDLISIVDSWIASSYVLYAITKSKNISNVPKSKDLSELLEMTDKKYSDHYIVGMDSDGKLNRLFSMKAGLTSQRWIKFNKEKK